MGLTKTRSLRLVLLLALILPLQTFAWVNCSSPDAGSVAPAHQHCGEHAGGTLSGDPAQHHHCGSCCIAALAATPLRFTPPASASPGISLPARWPPLKIALYRLDRPPRPLLC
jgi:hypothetical protein